MIQRIKIRVTIMIKRRMVTADTNGHDLPYMAWG
jgi:hypothetical protein